MFEKASTQRRWCDWISRLILVSISSTMRPVFERSAGEENMIFRSVSGGPTGKFLSQPHRQNTFIHWKILGYHITNSFVNNSWGWGWNTPSVSSSISSTCTGTAWSSRKKMRRSGGKYPDPPGSHRCATDVDLRMCVLMSLHLLHAKLCKHKYTTYLRSTPFRQYLCAIAATGRRRVLANKWSCKMPANGGKLQFERRGDSPFISNRCELRAYRLSVVTETKEGGR